ncbi:MAG: hypothetical protein K0S38_238 [Candidatus Paceibacter sp.]|jgi:hypothetical protein|nr:hypothetical protein [Candidatus Paceibacter sp.]
MAIKVSRTRIDFGTAGMRNYAETVNALGNVSGATAIDYSLGSVITATATGTVSWSVTNPAASGKASSFTLVLTNGGTAVQTWMSGTKWPEGVAPTLTASGIDILSFFSTDGGTTWYGVLAMTNSS